MPLTILMYGTVPHIMVRLERMLDYRGVGLARFHCITINLHVKITALPTTMMGLVHT